MTEQTTQAELTLSSFFAKRSADGARDLRAAAWAEFSRKGLPNKRVESWHYTDLRGALRSVAPLADAAGVVTIADSGRAQPGVTVQSLRDALREGDAEVMAALAPDCDDAAAALNAALMQDGVVVKIAPGSAPALPIELTITSVEGSVFTRSLVIVGAGAKVTLNERVASNAQDNHALALSLGAGASVEHVAHIGKNGESAVCVTSLFATLAQGAALNSFCLIEGGGLLRRQIFARLVGKHATVGFNGATLLRGRDHADTTIVIEHMETGGVSRERFRTILDGSATGVFQGKVSVRKEAQRTDGAMQAKALLLSDTATMNSKPELEIFADDVVCGHGATCGRLDADQLFYLQARGLPRPEAEALLIEGFAVEAMETVVDETLRDGLAAHVRAWLAERESAR